MAQLDSSLILQARQPQIESPVNNLTKFMQLQGLQQEGQMRGMQMQDAMDARATKNKLAELYAASMGPDGQIDRNKLYQGAAQRGLGSQIPGLQKQFADADEQQGKVSKAKAETDEKLYKVASDRYSTFKKTLGALYQRSDLNKDLVVQAGQELVSAGIIPAEMYQASIASMPDDPNQLRQRLREGVAAQMTPEQMFTVFAPKAEKIDNGQTIGFRDLNPNSPTYGQNTGGGTVQKQQTPDSIASNATTRRGQDLTDARGREANAIARAKAGAAGPDGRPAKPMPATALKMQNEAVDVIGIASSIQADLGTIEKQLDAGKLDFGPVKNVANNLKNMAGMSDEQSRNFSTFKSSMEKLRNDSLRLNKGVQTDGDAQRAWNELFQNINDKGLVKQRLAEIKSINARAVDLRKREVEDIRNNYNQPQYDFNTQNNVPSAITPPSGGANIDALLEKYK